MEFSLLEKIEPQLPPDVTIQFHWNGEPLMYPELGRALLLFHRQIRCFNTNGLLLAVRAEEIIGLAHSIAFSVVPDDPQADQKFESLKEFLAIKKDRLPRVIIRLLGDVERTRYDSLAVERHLLVATRTLHNPMGSFDYTKPVTVPETGICHDLLTHPAIRVDGIVGACPRMDPHNRGLIGYLYDNSLEEIWNGPRRAAMIRDHVAGCRRRWPLCRDCHFWGLPTP